MNSQISSIKYRDLVSVITPAFNSGRFVTETINSVLSQTYQNWELIIVDDGSTDETVKIVKSFQEKDNRIKLFENESNKGSAFSRNLALRNAKGKWIAFLDSDDVWHPEKLEKQIKFMTENNCHFSYTNYSEIDEDSDETGVLITGPKIITRNKMLAYCWPGCLTIMYDAVSVGVIQTIDIRINEEYALWINVSKKTDCYLLNENLAKYRRHSDSLSHQSYLKLIKWHYLMFRNLDKNVVASLILTAGNLIFGVYKKIVYRRKVSKDERCERVKG